MMTEDKKFPPSIIKMLEALVIKNAPSTIRMLGIYTCINPGNLVKYCAPHGQALVECGAIVSSGKTSRGEYRGDIMWLPGPNAQLIIRSHRDMRKKTHQMQNKSQSVIGISGTGAKVFIPDSVKVQQVETSLSQTTLSSKDIFVTPLSSGSQDFLKCKSIGF